MIRYEKLSLSASVYNQELGQLTLLSKIWADEKTMPSYLPNTADGFLNRELYLARDDDKIIAYLFGDVTDLADKTSHSQVGEKAFKLDEGYVLPSYRSQGIGRKPYHFVE